MDFICTILIPTVAFWAALYVACVPGRGKKPLSTVRSVLSSIGMVLGVFILICAMQETDGPYHNLLPAILSAIVLLSWSVYAKNTDESRLSVSRKIAKAVIYVLITLAYLAITFVYMRTGEVSANFIYICAGSATLILALTGMACMLRCLDRMAFSKSKRLIKEEHS